MLRAPSPAFRFSILGPLRVIRDGVELPLPGRRPCALLALLLVSANERRSSERLAEELWDGNPPTTARSSLQMHVHALRRAMGPHAPLRTVPGGYILTAAPDSIDAQVFERELAAARNSVATSDADGAARHAIRALALWRGAALEPFADAGFARTEVARLEELRLEALELRLEADLTLGRHAEVVAELARLVDLHPAREHLRAQLMLALYRSGRQSDALAEYQRARHYLVEELGLEPSEELQRLQARVFAHDVTIEPADSRDTGPIAMRRRSRLPAPPTPTVGRGAELEALTALLSTGARQLTTVLGPGGVGKTRLAIEAGRTSQDQRDDGVRFVPLASVAEAQDVVYALALALELPDVARNVNENAVTRHLASRDTLLILDNFEHVLDAAPVVAGIVAEAPAVTVLATSREPLHVRAEQLFALAPLDVSGTAQPAVDLFLDVVRARDATFNPSPGELRAIADLCRRLDGLPLAIELAAGRVGMLSVEEITRELGKGLEVLGEGPRDAPLRHRTMQATLEWSHDRLEAPEQKAFAEFAVFAGGATPAAAAAVITSGREALEQLAQKQLITIRRTATGERRLLMLETVRAFATEKLARREDAEAVRARHAETFAAFAEAIADDLHRTESAAAAAALEREIDNVRAAITWAIARSDAACALRLTSSYQEYLWKRAPKEGERWLRAALAVPGGETLATVRAAALWRFAMIPVWLPGQFDLAEAEAAARASFELAAATDDPAGRAHARNALAALLYVHQRDGVKDVAQEAVRHARSSGDPVVLADTLNTLTLCVDYAGALRAGEEAVTLYASVGNTTRCVSVITNLSYVALVADELDTARRLLAQARVRLEPASDSTTRAGVRGNEALLSLLLDHHSESIAQFGEVVAVVSEIPIETHLSEAVDGIAAATVALGEIELGARLHGAAYRLNRAPHHPAIAARLATRFFDPARAQLGEAAWDRALRDGASLAFHDMIALSLACPQR